MIEVEEKKIFLTISIPTYNRAKNLCKLLDSLFDVIETNTLNKKIGIFVSNNASSDNTHEILENVSIRFDAKGIRFEFQSLNENIGSSKNVLQTFEKPNSEYIWWFADDDNIYSKDIPKLINELEEYKPNVCNIGFMQPPFSTRNPKYAQNMHGFYENNEYVHEVISTKLTSIIVKKSIVNIFDEKEAASSLWPQVYIILPTILTEGKYYIFSSNIAGSDDNYLDIRYPPSAFYELVKIKEKIYEQSKTIQK
ncbi:MAG: glycosyltransferase, partial [Sedimenticola sp.]